jgi:hypothetical protein
MGQSGAVADPLPAEPFVVYCLSAVVGMARIFGSLIVAPGCVLFDQQGRLNELMTIVNVGRITHTDREITVVTARLLPPNINSAQVLLSDADLAEPATAVVQMPVWTRRSLVPVLRRAGFHVERYRTWISIGQEIGSRSELRRFRLNRKVDPDSG